jgi:hypothetical protein
MKRLSHAFVALFLLLSSACTEGALQNGLDRVEEATNSTDTTAAKLQDTLDVAQAAYESVYPLVTEVCRSHAGPTCVAALQHSSNAEADLMIAQAVIKRFRSDGKNFHEALGIVERAVNDVIALKNLVGAAQ